MAKNLSYTRPAAPRAFKSVNPREILPVRTPPEYLTLYPPLPPSGQRRQIETSGKPVWEVTTHVVPGAWPRGTPLVQLKTQHRHHDRNRSTASGLSNRDGTSQEERLKATEEVANGLLRLKARQFVDDAVGDVPENGRILWNVVNRYVPSGGAVCRGGGERGVTLLLTHANGFTKEIWEPFIIYLTRLLESDSKPSVRISEIWAFEAVQHGDAALLNEGKLGDLYDWSDHTRDILNFLLYHIPSSSSEPNQPVHLPRLSEVKAAERKQSGFASRTLVTIGHSFGGCTATLAALTVPALFSSLIMVDPVISPPYLDRAAHVGSLVRAAVRRREVWASREEAKRLFAATPFFAKWDPAALEAYVEHGITLTGNGARLKMPGRQEAVVFAELLVSAEVFEMLPLLDDRIELRWILAGKGEPIAGGEGPSAELVWRRPRNCSNIRIASAGHLITQEKPGELAEDAYAFLKRKYSDRKGVLARL